MNQSRYCKNSPLKSFISEPTYDTSKGTVAHLRPPSNSVTDANTSIKPGWMIAPKYLKDSDAVLEPLSKGQAAIMAIDNSFNYSVLGEDGFDELTALIDSCQCFSYRYSSLNDAVDSFETLAASRTT